MVEGDRRQERMPAEKVVPSTARFYPSTRPTSKRRRCDCERGLKMFGPTRHEPGERCAFRLCGHWFRSHMSSQTPAPGRRAFFRPLRYESVLRGHTWSNGFPRRPDRTADRASHLTRRSPRARLGSCERTCSWFTASAMEVPSATACSFLCRSRRSGSDPWGRCPLRSHRAFRGFTRDRSN